MALYLKLQKLVLLALKVPDAVPGMLAKWVAITYRQHGMRCLLCIDVWDACTSVYNIYCEVTIRLNK